MAKCSITRKNNKKQQQAQCKQILNLKYVNECIYILSQPNNCGKYYVFVNTKTTTKTAITTGQNQQCGYCWEQRCDAGVEGEHNGITLVIVQSYVSVCVNWNTSNKCTLLQALFSISEQKLLLLSCCSILLVCMVHLKNYLNEI